MEYEIGRCYDFEVIKPQDDKNEPFFRLRFNDREFQLPKLQFQRSEPLPDTLKCMVKGGGKDGPLKLVHFPAQYVNRFYYQEYYRSREFEFRVMELPGATCDFVKVEDEHGIQFRLNDDGAMLRPGQLIKCRFTRISRNSFELERCNSDLRLPLLTPEDLFEKVHAPVAMRRFLATKLMTLPVLADAATEFKRESPLWIVTALQLVGNNLSEWFVSVDTRRHPLFFDNLLNLLRRVALYLIEESQFLRNMDESRRHYLQERLTTFVEGLEPYRRGLEILNTEKSVKFVEDLMEKLRKSGYLYHPARQFAVLMLIMRTSPQLVNKYLGSIFDTIMEWKLETWTRDPFRSAFVDQFEIYIRHASAEINLLPQADTPDDNDRLEKTVIAIALQQLISGDLESEQARRNRALFYRCVSLLRPAVSDDLLDKAFLTLMGQPLPLGYSYDDVKQPLMMMTRASVAPTDMQRNFEKTFVHNSGNVCLTVTSEGIALSRNDESDAPPTIPNGMLDRSVPSPQVYLRDVSQLSRSNLKKMDAHRRLWSEIETALFEKTAIRDNAPEAIHAAKDETVWITIDPNEQYIGNEPVWNCRIDDPDYVGDRGIITRSDIVCYNVKRDMLERYKQDIRSAFVDENDNPRLFEARVKNIDDNGKYHFSMLAPINDRVDEFLDHNKEYTAVITAVNGTDSYSCISETGYRMFLEYEEDSAYVTGDIVKIRVLDKSDPDRMNGTIVGLAPEGTTMDVIAAFTTLLKSVSESNETDDEISLMDEESPLSREAVSEIIGILRFRAISSPELLEAYDYLLFGRQLARLINDAATADALKTHASLLRMHDYYAQNSRVDPDELELYRPLVDGRPLLEIIFHRLEIVSWLGEASRNADLWQTINASRNSLENTLARLVLSYNMLPDPDGADNTIAQGVKSKIAKLLGVNFERTTLKNYGPEGQYVEFKSSLVYPPRKRDSDKVEPDPERQMFNILRVIAGMLNASGGQLYIGVNDKTHYETGLFEDLHYFAAQKARVGKQVHQIKNIDNIINYLTNKVRDTWDANVTGLIDFAQDKEASHDVVIVSVKPRLTPTKLDGKIFVRRSTTTFELDEAETKDFVEERRVAEQNIRAEAVSRLLDIVSQPEDRPKSDEPATVAPETSPAQIKADETQKIPTSVWRPNVLHNYDEGYVAPAGYLIFSDDTVSYAPDDHYADLEPDTRLVLCFSDEELSHGYLVLAFEDQKVVKVPLREIIEKGANEKFNYNTDNRLMFACVAMPDGGLLAIVADNHNNLYRRITPLNEIEDMHLNSTPFQFTKVLGTNHTVCFDVVGADAMDGLADSISTNMGNRKIGQRLNCSENDSKMAEEIEKTLSKCANH